MTRRCPECGTELIHETRRVPYDYRGHPIEVDQPGHWCPVCGEGVLDRHDMKQTEKALHDHRAAIDGMLASAEVRRIRKKLRLTQHAAAALFGGGPNAFSRYERGEAMQSVALDRLLRLLDRYPSLLGEIEELDRNST